jgi:hypothetical protein
MSIFHKPASPLLSALAACTTVGVALGACQDTDPESSERVCVFIKAPITVSDGAMGHKPKVQRTGSGNLVVVYGDSPADAGMAYDLKADEERPARDIYVKTCKPDAMKSCDDLAHWSAARNISNSAALSSIQTAWQGGDPVADRVDFAGDIDKPNVKTSGTVLVVTWTSKYCPDGDLAMPGVQPAVQRAFRYLERDNRVVPFSCMWVATSVDNGLTWGAAQQLSTGERDAKQDSSAGTYDSAMKLVTAAITWQEDPQGLQLGAGDGPGDGASGATVNGGTDVWYTSASFVVTSPANNVLPWTAPQRISDNWEGLTGLSGQTNPIFDRDGANVEPDLVEKGKAGAARANIGMVGKTVLVAYEETKGSEGLATGKFIRYHSFPASAPPSEPASQAGCIISDPLKNARRVRFLSQGETEAGAADIRLAVFWKEGIDDQGGPSDIVVRRGIGGLQPANMVPAVDPACATSDFAGAIALQSARGENLSSNSVSTAGDNLGDDTELNDRENALAHRGVLRGDQLWIGYNYTPDLVQLWAQLDNYNFWLRKYDAAAGTWLPPENVTHIEDKGINVREPRIIGTPKSSDACMTDPTQCQDPDVVYLAWGTQVNRVGPFDDPAADLGIYITASTDAGETFGEPTRLSLVKGVLYEDEEFAFESQINTRPDGTRFYAVWNKGNAETGMTAAEYVSGDLTIVEGNTCVTPDEP